MYELKDDVFYEVLKRYPEIRVDYCLLKNEGPYRGEETHRLALAYAFRKMKQEESGDLTYELGKAKARLIDPAELLALPEKPWREKHIIKGSIYVESLNITSDGGEVPYWNAFLEPPYGCNYEPEDFLSFNAVLFPGGPEKLIAYSWSTDWSDYFDAGHEWWGASCWSVYDPDLDRIAVISASNTD